MQIPKELAEKYFKGQKKSPYLHSKDHVLADDLSQRLAEPKRFGFYLRMAKKYNHEFLRNIAGRVLEGSAKKPGALFAFLVKKEAEVNKNKQANNDTANTNLPK